MLLEEILLRPCLEKDILPGSKAYINMCRAAGDKINSLIDRFGNQFYYAPVFGIVRVLQNHNVISPDPEANNISRKDIENHRESVPLPDENHIDRGLEFNINPSKKKVIDIFRNDNTGHYGYPKGIRVEDFFLKHNLSILLAYYMRQKYMQKWNGMAWQKVDE
jgi:hypothetical protein